MSTNTRTKPKRRYTDADRVNALAALKANGGNINLTSRQTGIPHTTIRYWANGARHPEAADQAEEAYEPLADRLELVAQQLVDAIPAKIGKANLVQIVTSIGIAVDKARLLRGEATSISGRAEQPIDLTKLTDEELDEYERLIRKAESGTGGPCGPGEPGEAGEREGGRPQTSPSSASAETADEVGDPGDREEPTAV